MAKIVQSPDKDKGLRQRNARESRQEGQLKKFAHFGVRVACDRF